MDGFQPSTCPHDCPSTCALEIEVIEGGTRMGAVRGAEANSYTAGVICAKVARYAERANHADRLTHPLLRVGPKGSGQFRQISWDEALDRAATEFAERAASVLTWSADYLTYAMSPPNHYGMITFEGGGRIFMDITDVEPGDVDSGVGVRMAFRVKEKDDRRGFTRYFWKAVPVR
jgi:anaerobic selenocysteine-containing dehydrogenase